MIVRRIAGFVIVLPILVTRLRGSAPQGEVTTKSALIMGLGQAFAILPGISRSGSTIAAGMISGVNPRQAAEFSFLMAIPAILGGAVFEFKDLEAIPEGMMTNCIVGAVVAFATGLVAVYWVLDSIRKGKFQYFAIYCVVVGIFGIVYFGLLSDSEAEIPNDPVPELIQ
ncbi:MAG: undecaprenyl-diphosphate phosphatase, partial [Verrucomicrobiota bacterium]